ncbi:MAG: hypothetical protein EZS28_029017 [Streblomastix strix]|uniref:RRM domain-containing protein n=1 Tax=Streblomastix strix TaxID=222440 RepID=A0A5J4UYL7_9EUKA|nr:MAG: hypothetical protein EZS28_029017 [Streblomastix strix]
MRQSKGFGFANFATPAQALAARDALNGRNIFGEGRAMKITFARVSDEEKAKLYVANLPPNITPQLLRQQFQKYGIRDIWISRPRNISRQGKQIQQGRFAFIVLNDENEVQHAVSEQNNFNLSGWRMKVDRAVSKEDQMNQRSSSSQQSDADKKIDDLERSVRDKERDVHILQDQLKRQRQKLELKEIDLQIQQAGSDASELHVTGLGTQTTSEELLQHFKEFGAVRGYVINNPQTRQSRGYGFVAFLKQEDALNALNELNGSLINDKSINIDQSRNPQKFDYNIDLKKISDNIQQIEQDLAKAEEKVVAAKRELQTAKELPKQGAPDNNQEEELCPILGEILSEVESCECSAEKGHRLCCDCLKESLESDLHGYKLNLRCIVDPTCQAEYDMDLIERILDQRELLRIQELQAMEAGRNLTVTQNVQVRVQQQNFKTEEERKNAEIQEFRNLIVQTMTEALAEVCPKCKRAIIKEAGCNLITCPCRTCFCYNCGIDITVITYSHFNKGSNPCPLNVNDNTRINTDRQRRKARDAAEKFMQTHPRFDKVEERLNEYFKEFLD